MNNTTEELSDVWTLESEEETYASEDLSILCENASKGEAEAIELLLEVFQPDSIETILERAFTEGSTWIVWWLDGVHTYMTMCEEIEI